MFRMAISRGRGVLEISNLIFYENIRSTYYHTTTQVLEIELSSHELCAYMPSSDSRSLKFRCAHLEPCGILWYKHRPRSIFHWNHDRRYKTAIICTKN